MSRIIVKNLPKNITEDKLRAVFGEKGLITDVQLKYTKEGKFRQFCFIGYKDEASAGQAIEYYNKTRINTNKISVEQCALLGDSSKPRSWSKYAADSTAFKKGNKEEKTEEEVEEPVTEKGKTKKEEIPIKVNEKKKKKEDKDNPSKELLKKYKDDPMFKEFLQVHAAKEVEELLEDKEEESKDIETEKKGAKKDEEKDDSGVDDEEENEDGEEENEDGEEKLANKNISDLEYMKLLKAKGEERKPRQRMEKKPKEHVELFTLKLHNLPYNCKKKAIKDFFRPLKPFTIRIPRGIEGIAYVGFKQEAQFKKALLKDKSIINGKQIWVMKYTKRNHPEESTEEGKVNPKWKNQEEALKNEEDIAESGRIFLRNLAYTVVEDDIQNLFEKYGPIAELNLPIDPTTRKQKGFATVMFVMPEHAVKAYTELDGSVLHGRMLHLLPGKPKDNEEENLEDSSNYKLKKAKQQKKLAGSTHNWNSLFLGHDAVAEVIASTYGTTKEKVLDPHGDGNAAVRLALGETQIIANTRKYLEEQGVVLDAFNQPATKRSKIVLIAKNLPANTTLKELLDLFQPFGALGRVLLPPGAITAIIEFVEPSEAKKAFSSLAYKKFKNLPLYLEWAPENSLMDSGKKTVKEVESEKKVEEKNNNVDVVEEKKEEMEVEEEDEDEPEPDTTLFVKNLDFKTTDESLRKHFESCGKINYATVALKKDKNNPENRLSMGYGFIRFYLKASADKALKTLQQSQLDGKSLELKRSERTLQNDVKTSKKTSKKVKQTGTKILVRNIPFQAKIGEVTELFKTFGEIKALRLPKKMGSNNSHRGFCFVDFTTNSDAKKAFEALCQSTHLYGRRLVLEWASKDDDNVDEIRKRTAEHFVSNSSSNKPKNKKIVLDE